MLNRNIVLESYKSQVCIPGFNVENFDILDAVLKGASLLEVPVIVQTTQSALNVIGINEMVSMFRLIEEKHGTETLLHYDHGSCYEEIKRVIDYGYTSVMADLTNLSKQDYIRELDRIHELCKKKNVKLELEVGNIPDFGGNVIYTELEEIKNIEKKFDIDSFAVSVGSIHGCREKSRRIDFKLLELIHNEIDKPLVIHGSSGLSDKDLGVLHQYGVSKINIETELRIVYKNAMKEVMYSEEIRPRVLIECMKEKIIDYIFSKYKVLGTKNKNE